MSLLCLLWVVNALDIISEVWVASALEIISALKRKFQVHDELNNQISPVSAQTENSLRY